MNIRHMSRRQKVVLAMMFLLLLIALPTVAMAGTISMSGSPKYDGGQNDMDVDGSITVTFNGTISKGANFDQISIKAADDSTTNLITSSNIHIDSSGKSIVITPSKPLNYGTSYFLYIPAGAVTNSSGDTGPTTAYAATFTTEDMPSPKNLTYKVSGSAGARTLEWTWEYPPNTVTGFRIYDGKNKLIYDLKDSSSRTSTTAPLKPWRETNLPNGKYTRYVVAYKTVNGVDNLSPASQSVTVTIDDFSGLATPTEFTGTAKSDTEILWSWVDNSSDETGFKIYDEDDHLVGRVGANQTSFLETNLEPDKEYTRYVRAFKAADLENSAMEGDKSEEASESTDDDSDSDYNSTNRTASRSRIADAIQNALNVTVSPSDIALVQYDDVDREEEGNYKISTDINRFVAFDHDALDGYGDGQVRITTSEVLVKIPAEHLRVSDNTGGVAVGLQEYSDNTQPPSGKQRVGRAYRISLVKYSDYSKSGYTDDDFSSDDPVYVSFYYDSWRVTNPESLRIHKLNGGVWEPLECSVNTLDHAVQTKVTELGRFALFEIPKGTMGSNLGSGSYLPGGGNTYTPGYPPGFGPGYGDAYNSGTAYNPAQYSASTPLGSQYPPGYIPGGNSYSPVSPYASASQALFVDTVNHWARAQIEALASSGIVHGTSARIFDPDKKITRAEFLTMLMGAMGQRVTPPGAPPFDDVRADDWFAGSLAQAMQKRIVTERGGYFRPYDPIQRQEMAAWIGRSLTGKTIFKNGYDPALFSDWSNVDSQLQDAVGQAVRSGLINGRPDRTFDPWGSATRAEAATIIYSYLNLVR
ncbi:hypothetical protein GJ688_11485 [Heliobacillus mobilis]|uniref:S-layer homology domain-containing protein n=1 Tax=Heliobacterium mobile TaxID=28064 RepID=A0A6I3SL09_HELMO|nr:S-layer homology domain-containing protein [Heliobacterium mobile]MTV49599.1 hypothetical protein [Heliobacterium mobile]